MTANEPPPLQPTAATLVVTFPGSNGDAVILTRRPSSMRRHPGQIAFPGGMIEPSDQSPLHAAIREAREEVGLELPDDLAAEALPVVGTLSSNIVIQPFWVRLAEPPILRPNPGEVDELLLVPLVDVRAPTRLTSIPHPRRPTERTAAVIWDDQVIWGATLRTLLDLLDRLSY